MNIWRLFVYCLLYPITCNPHICSWFRWSSHLLMAPTRKSRSVNKRYSYINEVSRNRDGDNANKKTNRVSFSSFLLSLFFSCGNENVLLFLNLASLCVSDILNMTLSLYRILFPRIVILEYRQNISTTVLYITIRKKEIEGLLSQVQVLNWSLDPFTWFFLGSVFIYLSTNHQPYNVRGSTWT